MNTIKCTQEQWDKLIAAGPFSSTQVTSIPGRPRSCPSPFAASIDALVENHATAQRFYRALLTGDFSEFEDKDKPDRSGGGFEFL
jgi:hypothetical protein